MKPGPRPGTYSPTLETRDKMREAKLGKERDPETRKKIRNSLLEVPKSPDHRANLSNALLDLEGKCLQRFEELKAGYPGHEDFFDANKSELLYAMQDVRSDQELKDLRKYIEVFQIESTLSYEYSSSSMYAAEDAMIALIDTKRFLQKYH